jgi:hypothetical protein
MVYGVSLKDEPVGGDDERRLRKLFEQEPEQHV